MFAALHQLPLPVRHAAYGGLVLGVLGCVTGLVVGLVAYPSTAWFATFEIGVPAYLLGVLGGLATGTAGLLLQRLRSAGRPQVPPRATKPVS
jgi:hypothetical protein